MIIKSSALSFTIIALSFSATYVNSNISTESNEFSNDNSPNAKDNNHNNGRSSRSADKQSDSSGGTTSSTSKPPHIIFILADDLGFNDVSFRGSSEIPTPNIDALAFSGIILNRYYVNPTSTASRSALMTGKYPIYTGMQHSDLYGAEPRGLPLNEKLMPQYFNDLGYTSHIVGKWHLGHYKRVYTPLFRGFKSHIGFWTGHHDYFNKVAVEGSQWGLDIRNDLDVADCPLLRNIYSTQLIGMETTRIITNHDDTKPLFLYVSHAAVHSANPYDPLQAPDGEVKKMRHIKDYNRRKYAAMVTKLDYYVGMLVQALSFNGMLNDSIIIFSTDNGGAAEGFNLNHGSNWPLRGVKNTLWEGGIRGAGLIWSPRLKKTRRVADQTMHIVDWIPTLLTAIHGEDELNNITAILDGVSMWEALSNDEPSPRIFTLHNIDDIWGSAAMMVHDWKVVKGTNYNGDWDGWYGPAGNRDHLSYDYSIIGDSPTGEALLLLNMLPSTSEITRLRMKSNIDCSVPTDKRGTACNPLLAPCLFNVKDDPCEKHNLAQKFPHILSYLLLNLYYYNFTAVPPSNQPLDPRGDPSRWNNTWTNFGDYEDYQNSNRGDL